jgi:flavin reductase (DIM6/NTAB) family NADH-FMN oxidoreductase RutF
MTFEEYDNSEVLSLISHPIAIITVCREGKLNGMTAAWVSRISIDPPVVCVSISPQRHTWESLEPTDHFGVSLLGKGQERLAMAFGTTSGRNTDKFTDNNVDPFIGAEGIPLISGSLGAFVCRKLKAVEAGDHIAVFGEVVQAWKGPDIKPLQWYRSEIRK